MRVRFACLLLVALSVFAQVDTGTITGRVVDPTGSAIPNVQITVVQRATNFRFETLTNTEGIYRVQSLAPGTYELTFQAAGFKRLVRGNVVLQAAAVLAVDAPLEIGATSESIEVTAQASLLETETSVAGTVTEGDTLYTLPLYQRYVTNSMALVPGVTNQTTGGTNGLGAFYVGGQRNTGTGVFEDGVFANDPLESSLTVIKPVMNSVEEVKVLTGTLPAEYGHSTSGVITTQEERYQPTARQRLRLRPHPHHDAPRVLQSLYHRAAAAGESQRRAELVHAARRQRRRPGRHSETLQRPQ